LQVVPNQNHMIAQFTKLQLVDALMDCLGYTEEDFSDMDEDDIVETYDEDLQKTYL